jgi:hypothetical protein
MDTRINRSYSQNGKTYSGPPQDILWFVLLPMAPNDGACVISPNLNSNWIETFTLFGVIFLLIVRYTQEGTSRNLPKKRIL